MIESLYYAYDTVATVDGDMMRTVVDGLSVFIVPSGWTLPPLIDSLPEVIPYYFEELSMWILGPS